MYVQPRRGSMPLLSRKTDEAETAEAKEGVEAMKAEARKREHADAAERHARQDEFVRTLLGGYHVKPSGRTDRRTAWEPADGGALQRGGGARLGTGRDQREAGRRLSGHANLSGACLDAAADGEDAMNSYIRANNIWNNCVSDINCSNESIRSRLQAHWSAANEA
jgi:hypothetical protein